jgi:solute carrier family 13 (sodium-dependent dicarboxylate transporter), member 2/3/5
MLRRFRMNDRHPTDPFSRVRAAVEEPAGFGLRQWTGAAIGPLLLVVTIWLPPPEGLSLMGWRTAGVAALMALLWISEALPIPATALLPLVLFPLLGLAEGKAAAAPYANPIVFLFLGGFLLALAMQRWGLHRRVALGLIAALGLRPHRIVAGFLVASAMVSMWVSNTATALMMLPIAASVMALVPEARRAEPAMRAFGIALMLAVAYGATTGGMATLIGTPPNALLAGFVDRTYGFTLGFGQWMLLGVPVTVITLPIVYFVLTRVAYRIRGDEIPGVGELLARERGKLGRFGGAEAVVAVVFGLTALAWVFRPLLEGVVLALSDTTIALAGALLLFLWPVDLRRGRFVMDWETAKGVPWDVLLLFGGGLSLAEQIQQSGLSAYLGSLATGLGGLPVILTVGLICFGILLLTELTSNTATAATFLPVVGAVAVSLGENPLLFLVPTALAANCSYMMPVGTPPNAIVFGSGLVTLPQMARAGLLLNIVLVPIIVGLLVLLGPWVFGLELGVQPEWAR